MSTRILLLLLMTLPWFVGCAGKPATGKYAVVVYPSVQTEPVASSEDAADDPAIWVNPTDPSQSILIGTDKNAKQGGLYAYNLQGKKICHVSDPGLNNADIRQGVQWGDQTLDLVAATRRPDSTIALYSWNGTCLVAIEGAPIRSSDPYGFCLGRDTQGQVFAINVGKSGIVEQFLLSADAQGKITGKLVATRKIPTQGEGCVSDDALGVLWVGEEDAGLWKFPLNPQDTTAGVMVAGLSDHLHADVEGLALYVQGDSGYVVVSSQGDNTFALFDRKPPHTYRGSFTVGQLGELGAVEETDGIEVTSAPLGLQYPAGIFVAQDGFNQPNTQNFKIVDWQKIQAAMQK